MAEDDYGSGVHNRSSQYSGRRDHPFADMLGGPEVLGSNRRRGAFLLGDKTGAGTQLSGMHVAMARSARGVQRGKGRVRVLALERGAIPWSNVFRRVALGALELRMLAFELPPRLRVVEFLLGHGPAHQAMIQAVVLGVAARAIIAARCRLDLRCMIAVLFVEAVRDFLVAIKAAKLCRSRTEHVALGTCQRPFEIVMRFRERPRRHLRKTPQGRAPLRTYRRAPATCGPLIDPAYENAFILVRALEAPGVRLLQHDPWMSLVNIDCADAFRDLNWHSSSAFRNRGTSHYRESGL